MSESEIQAASLTAIRKLGTTIATHSIAAVLSEVTVCVVH